MMQQFIDNYYSAIYDCLKTIPVSDLEKLTSKLLEAYKKGAKIFIAGNGGSAATASHLACDLSKTVLGSEPTEKSRRLHVIGLSDNAAVLTAWANDEGYEHIFSEQLKNLAQAGDMLIVISASGNSPNIIRAVETARDLKMDTVGMLGFGGGKVKGLLDTAVIVDSYDYGYVEGVHSVLGHLVTSWLCKLID